MELPPCDGGNDYQDYRQARFLSLDNKLSVISYSGTQLLQFQSFEDGNGRFMEWSKPILRATYEDKT